MVLETVAVETLALRAISRISMEDDKGLAQTSRCDLTMRFTVIYGKRLLRFGSTWQSEIDFWPQCVGKNAESRKPMQLYSIALDSLPARKADIIWASEG